MSTASLIFSVIGACFTVIGLLIGVLNWISVVLFVISLILGIIGVLSSKESQRQGIAGISISSVFGLITFVRLFLGKGIF